MILYSLQWQELFLKSALKTIVYPESENLEKALHISDEKELKKVFDKYYKLLVLFANGYVQSNVEGEDIVQEVFLGLWTQKNHFENENMLRSYLYKSVKNKCLNLIKHEKVKTNYSELVLKDVTHDLNIRETEDEILILLSKAIRSLPERKNEIINLTLRGHKNNEIAKTLNIKLQTVKTLKSQAYQILRKYFKNNEI